MIIDAAGTEAALEAERSDFVTFSSGVSSSDDWTADDEERWLEDERAEGRAVIEGTTVPLLWPVGAPRPPRLGGWGGARARVRATSG